MVCHSLLQWTTFCQTSPLWPNHLGWHHTAWLSFTELDTTVVLWSDWLVFCDYGFSVSALWCPLTTPTILLGFLLPWTWGISSRLLQQSTATAPYLRWGISYQGRPSWPWTWSSSSRPSCAPQQPLLINFQMSSVFSVHMVLTHCNQKHVELSSSTLRALKSNAVLLVSTVLIPGF